MPDLPGTPVEVVRYLLGSTPDTEEVNEFFRILSVERRRLVIARVFVLEPFGSTDANTLAHRIAGVEHDEDPETVSNADYKAVYSGLIQNHLPAPTGRRCRHPPSVRVSVRHRPHSVPANVYRGYGLLFVSILATKED